ncbi:hypothetical protein OAJ16_00270 [Deltaproteobacteria bacterium]|nr:hypothetical protein [Deltaproteobacteria bacterium]
MLNHREFFGICLLICSVFFATTVWSEQPKNTVKNINPSPEILRAMIPEIQQQFMNGLAEYAAKYQASTNAVQKFLLRQKRQQFLAEQLNGRVLTKWIGRIHTLLTTGNGKAYLEIELAMVPPENATENKTTPEFRVTMGTWNNASTDFDYDTLILPGTSLHSWLANFNEGQWVFFSGHSFAGDEDYLKEASPTETEAMLSPQFILKFELLDSVDFPESDLQLIESLPKPETPVTEKFSILFRPELTIRFYQDYRLSNYNWNYQSYIERWSQLVYYHWRNHPPSDYLSGTKPEGGEVFVQATVEKSGIVSSYQVNSMGEISDIMREAAKEATLLVPLPPLPEGFPDEELKVEFRFDHPPMHHLAESNTNQVKEVSLLQDNNSVEGDASLSKMAKKLMKRHRITSKMAKKLIKKLRLELGRSSFHEELRQEFSSHFRPHQRFDPSLELKIELSIDRFGKVVEQKLTQSGKSVKFQLAVLNGLSLARFGDLPKSLRSEAPYGVRLRVIP